MNLNVSKGREDVGEHKRGETMIRMNFIKHLFSIKNEIIPLNLCAGTMNCFLKKNSLYNYMNTNHDYIHHRVYFLVKIKDMFYISKSEFPLPFRGTQRGLKLDSDLLDRQLIGESQ